MVVLLAKCCACTNYSGNSSLYKQAAFPGSCQKYSLINDTQAKQIRVEYIVLGVLLLKGDTPQLVMTQYRRATCSNVSFAHVIYFC